jgi:putative OPT family oligopeptide transporter
MSEVIKPPGTREFTPRAVAAGMVVAVIMGAAYPYIVLKLGFGPNVSVVAAILGYLMLGIFFRDFNRWENNIVQTAGTSASQTAFMCILLAAFDLLRQSKTVHFDFAPTPWQSFLWLAAASILGLLLAVPLRRHFIVDEKLTYADGVAAAETIIVLDSRGREARDASMALLFGALLSGAIWLLEQPTLGELIPETLFTTFFGLAFAKMSAGFSVSLLSIGSGMIVGNRINISMAIGGMLSWVIGPHLLLHFGRIAAPPVRANVIYWVMWPATGMLIAGGLTALFLRWSVLVRTFKSLSAASIRGDEFPLKWVGIGVALATVALVFIQRSYFGIAVWLTLVSVVLALPLMLVGLRVLGETNWGPISQISNMMQALFAGLAPGNLMVNMGASGTSGTIATSSEAIMQDYKVGDMIGSTPKYLTYMQILAAPVGAAVVAYLYPVLRSTYGVGGDGGLSAPASVRWQGFAELLSGGISVLPSDRLWAFAIGCVVGILLTILEQRYKTWTPSPTGLGIGMVVPGAVVFTMVLGGLLQKMWERVNPKRAEKLGIPLASGLIAGEAIVAVVLAIILFAIEQGKGH